LGINIGFLVAGMFACGRGMERPRAKEGGHV
jgi:hypothetical protein